MQIKRTNIPQNMPSFNEWCKEFKVGSRCQKRLGIHNAQLIMAQWTYFSRIKTIISNLKLNA
jgi:hypothetical protein